MLEKSKLKALKKLDLLNIHDYEAFITQRDPQKMSAFIQMDSTEMKKKLQLIGSSKSAESIKEPTEISQEFKLAVLDALGVDRKRKKTQLVMPKPPPTIFIPSRSYMRSIIRSLAAFPSTDEQAMCEAFGFKATLLRRHQKRNRVDW
jgi:hypothetical protein